MISVLPVYSGWKPLIHDRHRIISTACNSPNAHSFASVRSHAFPALRLPIF